MSLTFQWQLPDNVPRNEAALKKYDEDVGLQLFPIGQNRGSNTNKSTPIMQVGQQPLTSAMCAC